MSRNGKLKKAQNVEKRRLQLEEAMESATLKQAAEMQTVTLPGREQSQPLEYIPLKQRPEDQTVNAPRRQPKQCAFHHCRRYVDSTCTVCPYCGHPLPE